MKKIYKTIELMTILVGIKNFAIEVLLGNLTGNFWFGHLSKLVIMRLSDPSYLMNYFV